MAPTWLTDHWDVALWVGGLGGGLILLLARYAYAQTKQNLEARLQNMEQRIADFHSTIKDAAESLTRILEKLVDQQTRTEEILISHTERISKLEGKVETK